MVWQSKIWIEPSRTINQWLQHVMDTQGTRSLENSDWLINSDCWKPFFHLFPVNSSSGAVNLFFPLWDMPFSGQRVQLELFASSWGKQDPGRHAGDLADREKDGFVGRYPICSMYGIFTNICSNNHPNVSKLPYMEHMGMVFGWSIT